MADDGRRGDGDDRSPGATYQVLVVMECSLEKLNILNYKQEVVAKHISKNLSRPTFPTETTEESVSEDDEVEEEMIEVEPSSKPDEILELTVDAAGRYLEWERVLKIQELQRTTREDIGKTQEKVSSRKEYINNQLRHPIQEYLSAQAKLSELPSEMLHKILLEVALQGGDQALLILSHTCQQFKDVVSTDYFKRQLTMIGADADT